MSLLALLLIAAAAVFATAVVYDGGEPATLNLFGWSFTTTTLGVFIAGAAAMLAVVLGLLMLKSSAARARKRRVQTKSLKQNLAEEREARERAEAEARERDARAAKEREEFEARAAAERAARERAERAARQATSERPAASGQPAPGAFRVVREDLTDDGAPGGDRSAGAADEPKRGQRGLGERLLHPGRERPPSSDRPAAESVSDPREERS